MFVNASQVPSSNLGLALLAGIARCAEQTAWCQQSYVSLSFAFYLACSFGSSSFSFALYLIFPLPSSLFRLPVSPGVLLLSSTFMRDVSPSLCTGFPSLPFLFFFLCYIYFLLLWSLVSSEVKLKQPNSRFYVILSVGVELRQSSHSPRAPRAMYSSTSNFYRDVNLCARAAFALSCIRGWKENFFDIISEEFYPCPVERLESNVCRRSSPYFLYSC